MITGQAPFSAATSATTLARCACWSSVMIVTTSPCSTVKQVLTMSSACSRILASVAIRLTLLRWLARPAERRQHVAREPLHLPELVERAEAADEVVDARRPRTSGTTR